VRAVLLFLLSATLLFGSTFKLYLKDGGYHLVREYQVLRDRIRYYSTERSQWEEIPKELVDLNKTERERKAKIEHLTDEARAEDEEEAAERELKREIASIPIESGAYFKQGDKIATLQQADYQVITDRKRRVLQALSPIPIVLGKATVVIKGEHAAFSISDNRPGFYLRLSKEERFGIIRLTPKKNERIVEDVAIVPVSKESIEERKQMDTFDQQLADGLYRVWPEKALTPGEYALVEFSDAQDKDDIQMLIWDFAVRAGQPK
jgi:hypothetical protein